MSYGTSSNNKIVSDLGKRLLEAARLGDTDEVSNLMSNGAPLTTDWLGTTPLHLAAIYGHTTTAEILIKSGISRDGRTKVDKAPLHFACQHGHFEIVKLLVNGGAHVNAADMLKMTPLHWAVEANSFDICLLLLKAGVRTGLKNKFDKTALLIAQEKCYESIIELLSDEKFKVLQEIDVLHQNVLRERNIASMKICRSENFTSSNSMMKKPKTRRFPMVAGTWAGGEAQSQERLEINERKKLGIFKRRRYHRDDIAASLLRNFHPPLVVASENLASSVSAASVVAVEDLSKTDLKNSEASPLQKLEQTVRLSTIREKTVPDSVNASSSSGDVSTAARVASHANLYPQTALNYTLQPPADLLSMTTRPPLQSRIPIISSLALTSLPPNIKAIPLNISAEDYEKENYLVNSTVRPPSVLPPLSATSNQVASVTKLSLVDVASHTGVTTTASSNSVASIVSTDTARLQSINHESEQPTVPINIPVNLLNQIIDGSITLHTLNNKSKDCTASTQALAGIDTEMGTIPLIPVSGEGGLKLIPVEFASSTSISTCGADTPTSSTKPNFQSHPMMRHFLPNHPLLVPPPQSVPPYAIATPNLSLLAARHGGFDVASAILAGRQNPISASTGVHIQAPPPSQMFIPTGIYMQPGHPAFFQMPGQPTALLQPAGSQGFVHSGALPTPLLHTGGHQQFMPTPMPPAFMHQAGQPVLMHQPHVPQYLYLERQAETHNPHVSITNSTQTVTSQDSPSQSNSPT